MTNTGYLPAKRQINFTIMRNLLFLAFLLPLTLLAQLTPQQAIENMGRGINLGNTLDPPTEGAWNNGPAQESYFDRYVEAGFTNVRVPVRWDEHTGDAAPFTVDAAWMNRVEQVVDWGLERGLYVTLNGHHEDWLKNGYSNPTLRARYDAIWDQIIERFQGKSDLLLYEMINEPNGMTVAEVDDLNARLLAKIRAVEPTRLVIYGGNVYSNAEQLYDAAIPNDDYVIGYFHSYDPWPFAGLAERDWGTTNDYQQLSNKMAGAAAWSAANNIPIHISEFGAIHDNDFNSRMRYYAHYVDLVQFHGFAWSVWDDGGMFGVLNRNAGTWPEVKDILIHTHNDSPNRFLVEPGEDSAGNPAVSLSWNNRSDEGQDIRIQRLSGTAYTDYETVAAGTTEFVDTDVVAGGSYTYRLVTQRADGTLLHGYPQRVFFSSAVQAPFNGVQIIPGQIEMADYDLGGEGLAYHDNEAANIPGGYRPEEGVDLEPNGLGGFHIGYIGAGEWVEFTVNVEQTGTYSVSASIASEQSNGGFEIVFPDATISMGGIPATGGWTMHEQMDFSSDLSLEAGEHIMRVNFTGTGAFNLDFLTFTLQTDATEEAAIAAGFLISPNPVQDVLRVQVPTTGWSGTTPELQLYGTYGEMIRRFPVAGDSLTIQIGDLPAGAYFLRMTDGPRTLVRRVVKR